MAIAVCFCHASKTPKPRDRIRPLASQPPATNEPKGNNKVPLLALPVEIRLRIYDRLLVSQYDRMQNAFLGLSGTQNQNPVLITAYDSSSACK
jgi:hypothetical protein